MLTTNADGSIKVLGQFNSRDVGQTLRRSSDNALIATVTSFINSGSVSGPVSIAATFLSGQWYMEPYQITLPFAPDCMIVSSEQVINAPSPAQIIPGVVSTTRTGNMENWGGTAITANMAFVTLSAPTLLQVTNDGPNALQGYNIDNVVYQWFAFKADAALRIATVDYTGDGIAPKVISGVAFSPTYWQSHGANFAPSMKPRTWAGVTGSDSRSFLDGSASKSDGVTFSDSGVSVNTSIWNTAGLPYRAIFFSSPSAGPSVEFFLNQVSQGTIRTNIPTRDQDLAPGFGGNGTLNEARLDIDYMAMTQLRT